MLLDRKSLSPRLNVYDLKPNTEITFGFLGSQTSFLRVKQPFSEDTPEGSSGTDVQLKVWGFVGELLALTQTSAAAARSLQIMLWLKERLVTGHVTFFRG